MSQPSTALVPSSALIDLPEAIYRSRILIVDDNEINRIFLERILLARGFKELRLVASAQEALDALASFTPDLVILDLLMPGMDGFECCRILRRRPEGRDLPVLVQTVLTEPAQRVKAFESGATDFISKPIFPDELYARVMVHLEKRLCLKDLRLYKQRVETELASARELQYSILPDDMNIEVIRRHCRLDIASYFEPSSEIGGDFWGIKLLFPQQAAFWVVDFSGHGVASALNAFRLQAYFMESSSLAARPGEYLSEMNNKLLQLLMTGQFATLFYGVIDTQRDQLLYASAGSPHPIILRQGGEAEIVDASGMLLGVGVHSYQTQTVPFAAGDSIVFYSDALIETRNAVGNFADEATLMNWLGEMDAPSASAVVTHLARRFRLYGEGRVRDDLTIGCLQRQSLSQ